VLVIVPVQGGAVTGVSVVVGGSVGAVVAGGKVVAGTVSDGEGTGVVVVGDVGAADELDVVTLAAWRTACGLPQPARRIIPPPSENAPSFRTAKVCHRWRSTAHGRLMSVRDGTVDPSGQAHLLPVSFG
jgi:hypothetical protein